MPGNQNGGQFLTVCIGAIVNDCKGFNAGNVEFFESAQHLVFTLGKVKESFLDGNHVIV